MQFGLTDGPDTFQRTIDIVLSSVRWKFAIFYLDDIIVFSKTIVEHMAHLKAILTLLKDGEVIMKPHKCFFLQTHVEYLGHIMSLGCLNVASKTCNAVQAIQLQTNVTKF